MPNSRYDTPPASKRMRGKTVTQEAWNNSPPSMQRITKVNRDADKYKKRIK